MDKNTILFEGHWINEHYKQRITTKEWKYLLLNDDDKIISRGNLRQLKGKNIGYGIVEVSKEPLKEVI